MGRTGAEGEQTTWAFKLCEWFIIFNTLGVCYLVVEHSNKPDLLKEFAESLGLNTSIVLQRRAGREFLMVMKLSKSDKKWKTSNIDKNKN